MMQLLLLISLYLPLLVYGQRLRTLDFALAGSGVQDTGANPLEELTVTLNYSEDLVNSMANPKVYAGTCTETLPGGTPNLNAVPGFTVTSASAPTASTYRLIFTMTPDDLGTYESPTNTFTYCVHLSDISGKVFEQVTVAIVIEPDNLNLAPTVSFTSASNGGTGSLSLTLGGLDVTAMASLCSGYTGPFNVGEEICLDFGLTNGESFGYQLKEADPLNDMTFTASDGATFTLDPATDADVIISAGDATAVNGKKMFFFLPNEFFYSGSRTVNCAGSVNIVDADGNGVTARRRLEQQEETPEVTVDDRVQVQFGILKVEDNAIPKSLLVFIAGCIMLTLSCCFVVAFLAWRRRKRQEEEEAKTFKKTNHSGTNVTAEGGSSEEPVGSSVEEDPDAEEVEV